MHIQVNIINVWRKSIVVFYTYPSTGVTTGHSFRAGQTMTLIRWGLVRASDTISTSRGTRWVPCIRLHISDINFSQPTTSFPYILSQQRFVYWVGDLSSLVRASDYIEFIHNVACSVRSNPATVYNLLFSVSCQSALTLVYNVYPRPGGPA